MNQEMIETFLNWLKWFSLGALLWIAAACAYVGLRRVSKALFVRLSPAVIGVFAFAAIFATCEAQKRNGGTGATGILPVATVANGHVVSTGGTPVVPVVVTPEEIAQGYRLESVVTNGAVSYTMPTNGAEYTPWSLRGGYETHFPLDLDDDFGFPFGTGVVHRLDVLSGGMVESLPRQRVGGAYRSAMSICAAREYASIVPEGANQDAYYLLDICATGALDCATVRVTCDGPSALGDHVVIAKTNQVCHVPLLAGATYAVQSTLPISHSAVSSGYASITTNSTTSLTVSLPLEFSFVQARTESTFALNTSPIDVGATLVSVTGGCCSCNTNGFGFAWICSGSCSCRGTNEHTLSSEVLWEGYSLLFYSQKYCPCYYEEQKALSEIADRGVTLTILDVAGNAIEWKYPVLVGEAVNIDVTVGGEVMSLQDFITLFNGRLRLRAWTIGFDGEHDVIDEPVPVSAATVATSGGNVFRVSVSAAWMSAFNSKTVKATGTASLVARAGASSSDTIQVQRQADVLYYSGHGSHDTGVLNGVAGPSDVSNHWHDVDTVVFAGCAVLDIGDKVGHYPDDTASHSASPGLRWIKVSGAETLLGYAYKAPLDEQGAVGIVDDWCSMRSSTGDVEAWMKANDVPAGRNACAIRVLDGGRIEYRYFRRNGRGWNLRSKYSEVVEEIEL